MVVAVVATTEAAPQIRVPEWRVARSHGGSLVVFEAAGLCGESTKAEWMKMGPWAGLRPRVLSTLAAQTSREDVGDILYVWWRRGEVADWWAQWADTICSRCV